MNCRSRRRLPEDNLKESEEHKLVREFCDAVEMPKLSEVRETFRRYTAATCCLFRVSIQLK